MSSDMIQKATAQPAPKTTDAKASMQNYIKQMQGEIRKALPAVITPERFTRIVLSALEKKPRLRLIRRSRGFDHYVDQYQKNSRWTQWTRQLRPTQMSETIDLINSTVFGTQNCS